MATASHSPRSNLNFTPDQLEKFPSLGSAWLILMARFWYFCLMMGFDGTPCASLHLPIVPLISPPIPCPLSTCLSLSLPIPHLPCTFTAIGYDSIFLCGIHKILFIWVYTNFNYLKYKNLTRKMDILLCSYWSWQGHLLGKLNLNVEPASTYQFLPHLSLSLSMPIPIPAHASHSISLPLFSYLFLSLPLHLPSPAYLLHFPSYMPIPHTASTSPAYHFPDLSHIPR